MSLEQYLINNFFKIVITFNINIKNVKKLIIFLYILKIFFKPILLRYLLFCKIKKKKKKRG